MDAKMEDIVFAVLVILSPEDAAPLSFSAVGFEADVELNEKDGGLPVEPNEKPADGAFGFAPADELFEEVELSGSLNEKPVRGGRDGIEGVGAAGFEDEPVNVSLLESDGEKDGAGLPEPPRRLGSGRIVRFASSFSLAR